MVNTTGDIFIEVSGIMLSIISYFMMSYYYSKFLNPRKESKYYILKYFFLITGVYIICRCSKFLYLYKEIPLTLVFIFAPFIFSSDKVSKKIFASLSWIVGIFLISFIQNVILVIRFDLTPEAFNSLTYEEVSELVRLDNYGILPMQAFAYSALALFVMSILIINNKTLKNKFEILLTNIFTFMLVAVSTLPAYFFIDFSNKIHIVIGLVSFTASIFIMTFSYSRIHFFEEFYGQKAENKFLKDKNKMQLNYYKDMIKKEEEIKKINHDIKNNLQVMTSLKKANEKEKMIQDIAKKLNENEIIKYSKLEILNIILNLKSQVAKEKGIDFAIEIRTKIDFMEEIDVSNLFSNILDNAIENIDSKNKNINLSVYEKMNYIIIKCTNTIDNKKNKEDKGKNHGYGLKIINDIAKKYNGKVKINQDSEEYEITILLTED